MYLQHTMLHTRVNITFVQNLRHSNTNCNFGFLKEFYGPLHIPSLNERIMVLIRLWSHNSKSFQYILILWLQPWLVKFFNHNKKSILSCLKLFAKTNLVSIKAQVVVMSFSVKLLSVVMLFPVIPAKCFLHLQSPRVNINTVYWHSLQLQNIKKDNICLY